MVITKELAQPIVDKLEQVMDTPVNVIDQEGNVVASSDAARIGTFHQGAIEAMGTRKNLLVYPEHAPMLAGTREGITVPLELYGKVVGAIGLTGEPDALLPIASVIKVAVISLMEQAQLAQQSSYKRKLLDNWVSNLIAEKVEDYENLNDQARFLNIDTGKTCSVVVIRTSPVIYNEFSMNEQSIHSIIYAHLKIHFYAYVGQGQYVFAVRAKSKEDVAAIEPMCENVIARLNAGGQDCYIGVGKPCRELTGYRASFFDAAQSVRIVERLEGEKKIIYYYEHQIFRLLDGVPDPTKQAFMDNFLNGRELDAVLFETLQTYFEQDKRINETAAALHIHRNTLIFRLNKTRDLYGLDPRSFRDAVTLQILLYMLKFPELQMGSQKEPRKQQKRRATV